MGPLAGLPLLVGPLLVPSLLVGPLVGLLLLVGPLAGLPLLVGPLAVPPPEVELHAASVNIRITTIEIDMRFMSSPSIRS